MLIRGTPALGVMIMADLGKRRFLKALSLAPVAAVAAQKTAAEAIANFSVVDASGYALGAVPGYGHPGQTAADEISNWKHQLKYALEHLEEMRSSPVDDGFPPLLIGAARADALRSVSQPIRLQIAQREARVIAYNQRVGWAERSVAKIRKKLGLLGVFLDV